jgi:small subunit ribosomal protein S17
MIKEENRGKRKTRSGIVVSNKMENTVVIRVERKYRHPFYNKIVTASKKYYAHDDNAKNLNVGDTVTIAECRPMSKLKRWRVVREG